MARSGQSLRCTKIGNYCDIGDKGERADTIERALQVAQPCLLFPLGQLQSAAGVTTLGTSRLCAPLKPMARELATVRDGTCQGAKTRSW
jgi:hypothetical protein